jgi:hypothetical protein
MSRFRHCHPMAQSLIGQSLIGQSSIGQSSTGQSSTVQSRSRADSAGWPFHARQSGCRRTALDCCQIRSRSRLLARKYPLLGRRKMPGNAFDLGRAFRKFGISIVRRNAVADQKQAVVAFLVALDFAWARRAPITSWHSQSLRLQSNSATSVGAPFVRTAWVRKALVRTALARRREEFRSSDCSGRHRG